MNSLILMSADASGSSSTASMASSIIMFVAIIAIFYFLIYRPQKKRDKEAKAMIAAMKKGDKVVTGKFSGQELKLDGEDYTICKLADILAIVE